MNIYTEEIIKGVMPKKILPNGYSLVLEGGGTRGFYSSGVFDAFMESGIMFPYLIGVSAGAANALNYISGQRGRQRQVIEKYVGKKEYLGTGNLLKYRSLFGYDYIFKTVPEQHVFWDKETFDMVNINFWIGATNCSTGESVWFQKEDLKDGLDAIIASCSVPFVSKIVKYNNCELLDGGISSPIPIEKSLEDGNTFHVIVLTRNVGYRKETFKQKRLLNLYYRKYPNFIRTMLKRDEIYNRQLELCEKLEREGNALIIRPKKKLEVGRTARDIKKLLELHDEGYIEGKEAVEKLLKKLKNEKI